MPLRCRRYAGVTRFSCLGWRRPGFQVGVKLAMVRARHDDTMCGADNAVCFVITVTYSCRMWSGNRTASVEKRPRTMRFEDSPHPTGSHGSDCLVAPKPQPADIVKLTAIPPQTPADGRRLFFRRALGVLGGIIAALVAVGAGRFAFFDNSAAKTREFAADTLDKLELDVPLHVPDAGAWLVKNSAGDVTAMDDRCSHLGCRHKWNPDLKAFQCPCHGSEFDISGVAKRGPATTPLTKLRIDDSDKTRIKLVAP
jgi:Rieske Fe-S protein